MAEGETPSFPFLSSTKLNQTIIEPVIAKEDDWGCALCAIIDKRLKMIQCDSCDKWFHFRCVGLQTNFDQENVWVCSPCQQHNEKYHQRAICAVCRIADQHDVIRCNGCNTTFHVTCAKIPDDVVRNEWICNVCTCEKPHSAKAKSTTSSARARANLKLEMLTAVKELKDKKAAAELDVAKKYLNEQHERDLELLVSQFEAVKDLCPDDQEFEESVSVGEDNSAIELIKSKRLENWINHQGFAHLRSKNNLEFDKLSLSSLTKQSQLTQRQPACKHPNSIANFPLPNHRRCTPPVLAQIQNTGPVQRQASIHPDALSRLQIAARQAVSKDLPNFYGDIDDWMMFISAFENSTKICAYSDEENLGRLQKCLKGDAKNAVRHFLTFPRCVPRVIETLRLLYGNEEKIIESLLEKIRKEPAPKQDDLTSLINYSISIQNLCGTLEASNMDAIMKNTLLVQELANKLPPQIKLNWGVYKVNTRAVTVKHLSDWLYELAKGACSVVTFNTKSHRQSKEETKSQPSDNNSKGKRTDFNVHHSSSEHLRPNSVKATVESSHNNNNVKKCCLCPTKFHTLNDCPDFRAMSSEQRWMTVKNNKLCRFCLGPHYYMKCKQRSVCGINGCEYKHHPKLHQTIIIDQKKVVEKSPDAPVPVTKPCNAHLELSSLATLRYIVVRLYNGSKMLQVVAFLDEGATTTMVNRNVVEFLGIKANYKEDLLLKWTKGISRIEEDSERISIQISGADPNSQRYILHNVYTVDDLELSKQSLDVKLLSMKYPYLRHIPAHSYNSAAAQMIIGLDNWKLGIPLKTVDRGWSDPVAMKTRLGWEIHGEQIPKNSAALNHHTGMVLYDKRDDELHDLVNEYFSLENFGVKVLQSKPISWENLRSKQILDSTIKNVGNRYEVGLLWRYDTIRLPDSFPMALNRFRNFRRQLKMKPQLATNVLEQMKGYVEKGYAEKLSKESANIRTERTWYLPIFARTHPKKPEKVRLVWDAAAKVGETSLNSVLLQGPDNYANLVDILRRFREGKIPLLADIKEWYHQIRVCERDQDSQRFLWPSDDPREEFDTYKLKVLSFGATCSPSTAIDVKERHALKYQENSPRAVQAILENHYVDDWLDRFDTEEEAIRIARQVKRIHSEAGFEIRKWISSSRNVIEALDGNIAESTKNWNCDLDDRTEKVLGMWWCVESDVFTFSLKYSPIDQQILTAVRAPTKREMLRTLMSVYDPLGFLASFLVHAKILLQDTWRLSIEWDEQITGELYQRWKEWVAVLPKIEQIRIPRHYSPRIRADNDYSAQLHIFVDASELAFSAEAYLRIEDKTGVDVVFVGAKTKTAPLKPLSIPKLELQSFVLGVRFSKSIIQSLAITIIRRCIWTDSSTVLRWLRADHRKYNQFVGARIGEILEDSKSSEWFWVPSELNVADDATRWKGELDLHMSSRWFQGPEFLRKGECDWPKPTFDIRVEPPDEMKKIFLGSHAHQVLPRHWIDVDVENVSRFRTLVRVQIIVRRFIDKIKQRIRRSAVQSSLITREDFQRAETELFRRAQYETYREEILQLQSGNDYVNRTSKIYQFLPYLDSDNVLRMRSRLDAAKCISFDAKRPIILPIDHRITQLLVLDYHEMFVHQNNATVLNEIRQRFLIPGLRVFLRNSVPKLCQLCKNKRAVPQPPQMADLPSARLEAFTRPFSYVGIDYAGPFYVNVFRRVVKRWIVLFTCLVVRAVHIEIASSLDTDSCIMCIRNFMNIRGRSNEIFSDRGTNFVGCDNELAREIQKIDHDKLHQQFTSSYTKWHFNPPSSPHMGGVWERLVRSIKTTLYAVMPHRNPNDELFRCWLMEVINIVNSRPLTFVPLDDECDEALTPNHFLLGSSNGMKPPGIFTDEGLILRRNWRIAQQLADNFWKKWIEEYLPIIARRSKWFEKVKPLEVDDIVLMVDEENIRNTWPKGRIIEVFEDPKTDQVRSVRVKTETGTYVRPVHKLAVLDVRKPEKVVESSLKTSTGGRMLPTATQGEVA